MKMFGTQSLSHYLFYISRFLATVIGLLALFIVFSLITNNLSIIDGRFSIDVPIVNFQIRADYKANTILTICSTLILYTLYIYLVSLIFKTFKAEKLFTKIAIKYLQYFTIANLIAFPLLYLTFRLVVMNGNKVNIPYIILHILIGILSSFLIAVFNRAYEVQTENDLTI